MKPAEIGEAIVIVLWIFNFIMVRKSRNANSPHDADFFVILEFTCLGFWWIFAGFNLGWW